MTERKKLADILEEAENGDHFSQVMMGYLLEHGIGTATDKSAARKWYERAADANFAPGQFALGLSISEESPELGQLWLERAAENAYPKARYALACVLLAGDAIKKNLKIAIDLLRQSADCGYKPALLQLSYMYAGEKHLTKKDIEKALGFARQAAEAGSVEGATWFGMLALQHGERRHNAEAMKWLHAASEAGDPAACRFLASVYMHGSYGIEKDEESGKRLHQKSKEAHRSHRL